MDYLQNSELSKKEDIGIVSVLIPLYNHENTVKRALDSLLRSDCKHIELIISDDASHDRSFEVASLWVTEKKDLFYRVIIFRQEKNQGITGNLNYLISKANGEFITLFASDDELTSKAIDIQKDYLQENNDKDFIFSNMGIIDQSNHILVQKMVSQRRAKLIKSSFWASIDMVFNWGPPWPRLFARRLSFNRFGGYYKEHSLEDRWSAIKIFETRRYGYIDVVTHLLRMRNTGFGTGGISSERLAADMFSIEKLCLNDSTGMLKVCIYINVQASRSGNNKSKYKWFYVIFRKIILTIYRKIVLEE